MTRTVDATLHAAAQAGIGKMIAIGYIGYSDGSVSVSGPVSQFKLTGTTLQFTINKINTFAGDQTHIWLTRGLTIAGTDYTITTGRFAIHNQQYLPNKTQLLDGGLFPNTYYSADGYKTYDEVINAFCTHYGKTAVYREPGEAWHGYRFLGATKNVLLNSATGMLNVLQQKRMVQMCDIGSEQVLVYCPDAYGGTDLSIVLKDAFQIDHSMLRQRQFIWQDELEVYHQDGGLTDPIHNLGYMESTANPPARHSATHQLHAVLRPDLRILDGDRISLTAWGTTSSSLFAKVTEKYDAATKGEPQWRTEIDANTVFNNTEAGQTTTNIERTANFIPVSTSNFDLLLSDKDSNLQHALNTLNDHRHFDTFGMAGALGTIPAGQTRRIYPYFQGLQTAGSAPLPSPGMFQNLYFIIESAQPGTGSLVVTLSTASTLRAITITIPAGSGVGVYTDLVQTYKPTSAHYWWIEITNNASSASAQIGACIIQFKPKQ